MKNIIDKKFTIIGKIHCENLKLSYVDDLKEYPNSKYTDFNDYVENYISVVVYNLKFGFIND